MKNIQAVSSVTAPAPAPVTPPEDPMFLIQKLLALHGYASAGMYRAAMAFLKNYDSVQGNSMDMMNVSETVQNMQIGDSNYFVQQLSDCSQNINQAIDTYNKSAKDQAAQTALNNAITANQGQSSVFNTEYNSTNQFWSGMNNGVNQTSADETQTESLDMQMFQQGVLTLAQQLASVI